MAQLGTPAQWMSEACRGQWHQKLETQEAITTIHRILINDISVRNGARILGDLYEPRVKRDPQGNGYGCAELWTLICDASRQLGHSIVLAQKICDILVALAELPDLDVPILDKQTYWRDLPKFGITFREYGISGLFSDILNEGLDEGEGVHDFDDWYLNVQRLSNACTFGALFLSTQVGQKHMNWFAGVALDVDLEKETSGNNNDEHVSAEVLIAAVWMRVGGRAIYRLCCQDSGSVDPSDMRRRQDLALGNWKRWKAMFGNAASMLNIDVRSRQAAEAAASMMSSIETDGGRTEST